MNKNILPLVVVCTLSIGFYISQTPTNQTALEKQTEPKDSPQEEFKEWAEHEFEITKDPRTNTIPNGTFAAELQQALRTETVHDYGNDANIYGKGTIGAVWENKGPTNVGGRTRAVGIDVNNNNIIIAGCVSGGVMRTTNGGTSWTNVSPVNTMRNITSIAQDTRAGQTNTWYFGSGEGSGNSASGSGAYYYGNGIYKSIDNGQSWAKLANSNTGADESFDNRLDMCYRLAVNPVNGDVYAAAVNSIYRSTNGGATWTNVLGASTGGSSTSQFTDIVISSTGVLYAGFGGTATTTYDGVWTSTNGTTWTRIANSATVTGWNAAGSYGRIVLAIAPSAENIVYALYYNNNPSTCAGTPLPQGDFFVYNATTGVWTDRSANLPDEAGCLIGNDPFACQGGYDLCITVKPDDVNTVFIGGTNVYRSTTAFSTNTATTRIGGYASPSSYSLYANHHPDIHELKFGSASNTILYTGDDGGVQKGNITATPVVWTSLNSNYQTYQYYYIALDPSMGSSLSIGGAQDNGTTRIAAGATTSTVIGSGDGCSVGLVAGGNTFFSSTQGGNMYRKIGAGSTVNISPTTANSLFVTNFHLDPDNTNNLYFAAGNQLYRTGSSTTVTSGTWTNLTGIGTAVTGTNRIYAIATSRGTYSANTAAPATLSRLYVGSNGGKILRLDDPINAAAATAPADITPAGSSGTCISIAVDPTDSRKVLAAYSNYGVPSLYYTSNASLATPVWNNVEGNISLLSARSVLILSNGSNTDYMVGTSKGLYATNTLNGASTVWQQEAASTIGYVPVVDLDYRVGDQSVLAGSHGAGMFYSSVFPLPVKFVELMATAQGQDAQIKFSVSGSENVSHYQIQESKKGGPFQTINTIAANNSSNEVQTYFLKAGPYANKEEIFFRVRAVEHSGDGFYSEVVNVNFDGGNTASVQVYPTLCFGKLTVASSKEKTFIRIINTAGQVVLQKFLSGQTNEVDVSMLSTGMYVLEAMMGNQKQVLRFTKM